MTSPTGVALIYYVYMKHPADFHQSQREFTNLTFSPPDHVLWESYHLNYSQQDPPDAMFRFQTLAVLLSFSRSQRLICKACRGGVDHTRV